MNNFISISHRRIGVALNFSALFLLVFVFELVKNQVLISGTFGIILIGIFLLIVITSFYFVFSRTGSWRMSHQSVKDLDERQIQVLSSALRLSYLIFVVFTLLLIYGYALIADGPIDVVIAGALLYVAHILPASIITWTEKQI